MKTRAPHTVLWLLLGAGSWCLGAACGNDGAVSALGDAGVIQPSLGGNGGKGASGAGGEPTAGAGGVLPFQDTGRALGSACHNNTGCPHPLTCLASSSQSLNGAGPPGGMCTLPCTKPADCSQFNAHCLPFGSESYCVQRCQFGAHQKCHDREDFACEPTYRRVAVSCDVDADCASSAVCRNGSCYVVQPLCLPRCARSDCPRARYCDPVSGACIDHAPAGDAPGARCDPELNVDSCRGACLAAADGDGGRCNEFCRLGSDNTCGPDAACLLTLQSTPEPAAGDLASCATLCDCSRDCASEQVCLPLASPHAGRVGYCAANEERTSPLTCPGAAGAAGSPNP